MTETLAYGYSSESTQRELSNEYQPDRVQMVLKKHFVLVLLTKVASALEGLRPLGTTSENGTKCYEIGTIFPHDYLKHCIAIVYTDVHSLYP